MARHRTFTTYTPDADADQAPPEPVTFTLEGGPPLSPEPWSESFTCVLVAPAGVLDDFVAVRTVDEKGNSRWDAPSLLHFLDGVLVDDDVARMRAVARDKKRVVPINELGELVVWLSEQLLERPTTPPSS